MKTIKFVSVLLSLLMLTSVIGGLSLIAHAQGAYSAYIPAATDDAEALAAKKVLFNTKEWYVIEDNSTAANEGTLTLLMVGSLGGNVKFDDDGKTDYLNSTLKQKLDTLVANGKFYEKVSEAINDTGLGKLYIMSKDEAEALTPNVASINDSTYWWLRTPSTSKPGNLMIVKPDGTVGAGGAAATTSQGQLVVRPALQLNLSKVVFDSATKTFAIPATEPTITSVTGTTLAQGYVTGAGQVKVEATAAEGHTISGCQWYYSETNTNENGTLIDGATGASYIIPAGLTTGTHYYYCVVTATRNDNGQTASATSDAAAVRIAADADEVVAMLAADQGIDLNDYYLIPEEDMFFVLGEVWQRTWVPTLKRDATIGDGRIATKQFTNNSLPKEALIFAAGYYQVDALAWPDAQSTATSYSYAKVKSTLFKIEDEFASWDSNYRYAFNFKKYVEGTSSTTEPLTAEHLANMGDAFRIYVPKGEPVAEVNGTQYLTVMDAIRAAGAGDTVKLLKDTAETIEVKTGKNIVLDLDGYTLTNDGRHSTIVVQIGATLVMTGNGTVDNTEPNHAPLFNNGGTVTLNNGNFIRSEENDPDNSFYTFVNRGTMTINEGVSVINDTYNYSSLIDNGYRMINAVGWQEIDPFISLGYQEGESAATPTLIFNGGTFTGGKQTLKNDVNGVAVINGGDFSSSTGHALYNVGNLTVNGGTFTAATEGKFVLRSAYESGKANGPESASGTTTVNGGTFTGNVQKDENAAITISGGAFTVAVPEDYCAEGCIPATTANTDGKYVVIDTTPFLNYKAAAAAQVTALAAAGDSEASSQIIADAIAAINALTYDTTKTPDENIAAIKAIETQTANDLETIRSSEIEQFNAYKAEMKANIKANKPAGDSKSIAKIIAEANSAIDAIAYDDSKTLEENKAAVTAIADSVSATFEAGICAQCGQYHGTNKLAKIICCVVDFVKTMIIKILPSVKDLIK